MRYQQECPDDEEIVEKIRAHVRDQLAIIADADDDPATNADDVRVWVERIPEEPGRVLVVGDLDAEPDAPYLKPGFDPLAGLDPELYAAEVEAAQRDEEALRG